jgi:hypothetical protein
MFGEINLNSYMRNMKLRIEEEKRLKPENFGKVLSKVKLKLELLICFIKTLVTENQISKI